MGQDLLDIINHDSIIPSLPPVLSWNGTFSLTRNAISTWNDLSSVRLQLNNREVTCYFVSDDIGHELTIENSGLTHPSKRVDINEAFSTVTI